MTLAKGSFRQYSLTLTRKQEVVQFMLNNNNLNSGKSVSTGWLKLLAHQVVLALALLIVIMHRHGILGPEQIILHKPVFSTTEEDLSNCHGITTTELFPRQSMRAPTIVTWYCYRILIECILIHSQYSCRLFGFTWLLKLQNQVCTMLLLAGMFQQTVILLMDLILDLVTQQTSSTEDRSVDLDLKILRVSTVSTLILPCWNILAYQMKMNQQWSVEVNQTALAYQLEIIMEWFLHISMSTIILVAVSLLYGRLLIMSGHRMIISDACADISLQIQATLELIAQ